MVTTLLVLEDEPIVMKLLRNILKPYSLIEAVTGEEALVRFIDYGHRIDLLIADVTLPQISGIQVALIVRSKIPRLPIILTSGYPVSSWPAQDAAGLQRLGLNSVAILQKPFQVQALRQAVCELVGARQRRISESRFAEAWRWKPCRPPSRDSDPRGRNRRMRCSARLGQGVAGAGKERDVPKCAGVAGEGAQTLGVVHLVDNPGQFLLRARMQQDIGVVVRKRRPPIERRMRWGSCGRVFFALRTAGPSAAPPHPTGPVAAGGRWPAPNGLQKAPNGAFRWWVAWSNHQATIILFQECDDRSDCSRMMRRCGRRWACARTRAGPRWWRQRGRLTRLACWSGGGL